MLGIILLSLATGFILVLHIIIKKIIENMNNTMCVFLLKNVFLLICIKYCYFVKVIRHRLIGCSSHQPLITYVHETDTSESRNESEHG